MSRLHVSEVSIPYSVFDIPYSIYHQKNNNYSSTSTCPPPPPHASLPLLYTLSLSLFPFPSIHSFKSPLFPPPQSPPLTRFLTDLPRLFTRRLTALLTLQRMGNIPMISLAETPGGMKHVQGQHGQDDHRAFEHDEVTLILNEVAFPALRELDDTVDAADEDADRGEGQGDEEAFEFGRGAQGGVAGFADVGGCAVGSSAAGIALGADGEVDADEDEDGEGEDLECEAGDHDVVPCVGRFVVVRCHAGHAAADGLE